jgi:hypothetical protein
LGLAPHPQFSPLLRKFGGDFVRRRYGAPLPRDIKLGELLPWALLFLIPIRAGDPADPF